MQKHLQLVAYGIVTASFVACSAGDTEDAAPTDAAAVTATSPSQACFVVLIVTTSMPPVANAVPTTIPPSKCPSPRDSGCEGGDPLTMVSRSRPRLARPRLSRSAARLRVRLVVRLPNGLDQLGLGHRRPTFDVQPLGQLVQRRGVDLLRLLALAPALRDGVQHDQRQRHREGRRRGVAHESIVVLGIHVVGAADGSPPGVAVHARTPKRQGVRNLDLDHPPQNP